MNNFIIREEYFGGSIVNRARLTFDFLNKWQTKLLRIAGEESLDDAINKSYDVSTKNLNKFIKLINERGIVNEEGLAQYDYWISREDLKSLPRGMLRSPLRLYFEITRKCNLHCRNCFSSSGVKRDDEFTYEEVTKVLDALRDDDVLEVRFTGGEPTQRSDWKEVIAYAKNLGMAVSMNSSGVYYNSKETLDDMVSLDVDQIILSLDGNKDSHEALRGAGNYDKTLDSIMYLSSKSNNVRINTILKGDTLPLIPEMVELAKSLDTEMCFILLRPVGRGTELIYAIPEISKLHEGVDLVNKLRNENPGLKIITSYDVIKSNSVKAARDIDLTGCSAGLRGVGISSWGRVECCGFLNEVSDKYYVGNVKDYNYSLRELWRYSENLKKFREFNLETNKECVSCDKYIKECYGTCATMKAYKDVNELGRDPYCIKCV